MAKLDPTAFLNALWKQAPAGSFAEVRAYQGSRGARSRSIRLPPSPGELTALLDWAARVNATGFHVAHGVQPRIRTCDGRHAGRAADVDSYVALVTSLAPRQRELVLTGDYAGAGHRSRSEASLAVARALAMLGATDDEIAAVLLAHLVGAEVREKGPRRLQRILDEVRGAIAPDGLSKVEVLERRSALGGRVELRLKLLDGPHAGTRWWQGVASQPKLRALVRAAAGLAPMDGPEANWTAGLPSLPTCLRHLTITKSV